MKNSPIKIHAVGLDERGTNTLNFFFQKFCIGRCEMVTGGQAEVFMINMDSINAAKQRATLEVSSPLTPIILMSLHIVETERHYFIRKPLIADHLLAILTEIEALPNRQLKVQKTFAEDNQQDIDTEINSVTVDISEENAVQPVHSVIDAAQKLSHTDTVNFVGNRADIDLLDEANKKTIYFDPKRYYLGHVQEAIMLAKDKNCSIKLTGLSHTLFISPNSDSVYIELSDAKLRYYGITTLYKQDTKSRYRTRFSYDFIKDEDVEELCNKQPNYKQNLQSFLWKLSLWTSRGRLPLGVPLDAPVHIQAWPNFTRLVEIPNAMQIVARWLPKPKSIINMAENFSVPQRILFSFFTATYMIGLSGVAGKDSEVRNDTKQPVVQKRNGLFSRLMKKLATN
ncbi:MAG: hypothetical protein ACKE8R_05335 [Methylophagaceae bacterium]